jgi:1-acyl-sn-glycerol-3-phosphate acyltransferase
MFVYGALELAFTRPATRTEQAEWLHRFAVRALRTMGISYRVEGHFPKHGALVSNHLGYLDVMTFAALGRVVFVSMIELSKVPLLGWMTTMSGTIYVERGRGGSADRARAGLESAAEEGLPVVFFPEGNTTNGSTVLPFHSGILAKFLEVGEPVTAAHVKYRFIEDNGPGMTIEDDVCYWGEDAELFSHMFRLLAARGIEVSVKIADAPIAFSVNHEHRKIAAEEARAAVMELGGVVDAVTAG